jgi:hypothetical protein
VVTSANAAITAKTPVFITQYALFSEERQQGQIRGRRRRRTEVDLSPQRERQRFVIDPNILACLQFRGEGS